ncbi:MAG: hypothetical protein OEV93_03950 [Candidatus Moranbacteria bacterium]|nr:hypothetical protein [Candidatus Moranbacteria bacterium]
MKTLIEKILKDLPAKAREAMVEMSFGITSNVDGISPNNWGGDIKRTISSQELKKPITIILNVGSNPGGPRIEIEGQVIREDLLNEEQLSKIRRVLERTYESDLGSINRAKILKEKANQARRAQLSEEARKKDADMIRKQAQLI